MKSGAAGKKVTDPKEGGLRIGPYEVGQIMDRLGAGALLVDLSTRAILRANEAFCRLSGFKAADIERIDLAQLHQLDDLEWILSNAVHPEQADQILPAAACAGKDEKPWSADVRLTGLTEGGGSVVLLTYSPPEGSPAKRSKAPRPSAAAPVLASVPAPTVAPAPPGASSLLTGFTQGLAAVRSREELGRVLVEASDRLLGCGTVLLLVRHAAPPGTEVVLSAGLKEPALEAAHRWLDGLLAGVLASADRPIVAGRQGSADPLVAQNDDLKAAGVEALAVFPLENEGRLAGAWVLGYADLRRAEACNLGLGRTFAAHLAGTLVGLLLLERTRKEKRHQEVLNRIISCLRGPFELDEFLRSLTGELAGAIDADRCLILLAPPSDTDPLALPVDFEFFRQGQEPARACGPIALAGTALGQAVLFSKDPLVTEDLRLRADLTEDHETLVERLGLRGLIAVKILSHAGFSGLVVVATSAAPRRWVAEEIDLVRAVADHISITLETGRLMKANEDRTRQLKLLTEVQQAVGRLRDVGAVLQEAVEALCRSFGYRQARIATLPEGGDLVLRAWAGEEERLESEPGAASGRRGEESLAEVAARTRDTQVCEDIGGVQRAESGGVQRAEAGGPKVAEIAIPLIGADQVASFPQWQQAALLSRLTKICVMGRPETKKYPLIHKKFRMTALNIPQYEISSSEVRVRLQKKMSLRWLVPDSVSKLLKK